MAGPMIVVGMYKAVWVIPYQITQKKKIFPVQIIDFDEILLIETLIQFIGPCKILFLYSK